MVTRTCYRFLPHPGEHGPRPRAQPDRPLLLGPARGLQEVRRQGLHRHQLGAVRERRRDEAGLGRRLFHLLLRVRHPDRQGDAVLRRTGQPGQVPAVRHQRRRGRKEPRAGGPGYAPITSEYLTYDEVLPKYVQMLDWLAGLYVNVLNLIQYMHDKYYYEEAEMALIDTDVRRTFATGIAGFSHVIDSLSAIKYAKVKAIRDDSGLAVDFAIEGDFPKYGNDDDRADDIGVWLLRTFLEMIKQRHTYRNSEATTSILTITSNVVYGKYTGALPDGRKAYTPFAPGANPSYGR